MLVGAGFFEASSESRRTWQEVAPVEPGIQQRGDQIVVTVTARLPMVQVQSVAQIHWLGGDQPARNYLHTLRVRRGDRWTEFRWSEPLNGRRPEDEKTIAAAGKRIRALVTANLTDARMLLPVCL